METQKTYTAFAGSKIIADGGQAEVAKVVKGLVEAKDLRTILVFSAPDGQQVDLDLRGSMEDVLARLEVPAAKISAAEPVRRSPGRPKLGVVGREVTLLPRHWQWLNVQPGGASVALRKLVEQARRSNHGQDQDRKTKEAVYRFISAIAGNESGYEEACRALFAGDRELFARHIASWPVDVREFTRILGG